MAEGRSNAAIARELSLTDKAVVQHVSNIYERSGSRPATTTTAACSRCSAT